MTTPDDRTDAAPPALHLHYRGLQRPARLERAEVLLPLLSQIVRAWPATRSTAHAADPFVTLRPLADGDWQLDAHLGNGARSFDPVNAVCDFVAELSWERIRSHPEFLCLHAAGVAFGGRLVLFPSARRAGKSTLATALARLGHRLYSDDFVQVEIAPPDGLVQGHANGIAPRLRLPLPDDSSPGFRAWVAADPGPANAQYKYLATAPLAAADEALPLGAIVVLDRADVPTAPRLDPIAPEEALARLILQNFARATHAGGILQAAQAIVAGLPTFRLSYSGFEAAAELLHTAPELAALAPTHVTDDPALDRRAVLPQHLADAPPAFDPATAYAQAPGLTETGAGDDWFLADGAGTSIHRLNAGSALIWRLLAEPIGLDDIAAVIAELYPDAGAAQIRSDAERCLRAFLAARLIAPAGR
ncbi:MAG: PqqD family peptide modification chaperone [Maritimibacter sp.]|nr:PqqD family peptide modification chaperone [Maritimibacter sp.]